ncbi:hypothetical protein [Sphingomonas morindae]|uniref:Terminase small subunit n=1 Tax=Sphingomonas morindae TaxID=1541170 RepID=A0ABY4X444_9SPHN|nr:hypothetical protein [Sphingomonas morindae]USI71625.1 hypothetical protein LHA26_09780 [Sphingomonas morindae]
MDLAGYRPTLNEVAALFGKSSRWISDLRASGEMPADGASLADFVAAWGSYCGARAGGAGGKSIDLHKARLAAEKADEAAMKNAQRRRELLPRALVTHAVQGAFARVRSKLLALPAKSAPAIASMKSAVAIQEKLTELVHEALAELARTDVEITGAATDAAPGDEPGDGGDGGGVVAGVRAAAPADGEPVGRPEPDAQPGGKRRARKVGHKAG